MLSAFWKLAGDFVQGGGFVGRVTVDEHFLGYFMSVLLLVRVLVLVLIFALGARITGGKYLIENIRKMGKIFINFVQRTIDKLLGSIQYLNP